MKQKSIINIGSGQKKRKFLRGVCLKKMNELILWGYMKIQSMALVIFSVIICMLVTVPAKLSAEMQKGLTTQDIAEKALGSTLFLITFDEKKEPLSTGSGFYVGDGKIASNLHVIEGATEIYAKLVGHKITFKIDGILAMDDIHDLVILQDPTFISPALALGDSSAVRVGETIYVSGNPEGLEGTFTDGIISSIRENENLIQISAPISKGSSGGPVLNSKAEVIGISVAIHEKGQNLNFAVPSNYLKELLEKANSIKPIESGKVSKGQKTYSLDSGEDDPNNYSEECYHSKIVSPRPFKGNEGDIFKLSDGSVWKIRKYEYVYEYDPMVIVCSSIGKLFVDKKFLSVKRLSLSGKTVSDSLRWKVYEETELEGSIGLIRKGDMIEVVSGHIYEVMSNNYYFGIGLQPEVLVLRSERFYYLVIEGYDEPIMSVRLK